MPFPIYYFGQWHNFHRHLEGGGTAITSLTFNASCVRITSYLPSTLLLLKVVGAVNLNEASLQQGRVCGILMQMKACPQFVARQGIAPLRVGPVGFHTKICPRSPAAARVCPTNAARSMSRLNKIGHKMIHGNNPLAFSIMQAFSVRNWLGVAGSKELACALSDGTMIWMT